MFSRAYGGKLAAVRGHAPLPWVGYGDAKDLNLARRPLEAHAVGDATP